MSNHPIIINRRRNANTQAHDEQPRIKSALGPILAFCITIYFCYHIFQGDRGVISWIRLQKKIKIDEDTLQNLTQQKEVLERQVYLLRPDSLDVDMLEERARILLNYARPNEIIIHDTSSSVKP
jgi:cell division protein FtsB